ncbi:TlpA family protein disulfide reductase [Mesorhizobium sp. ANAO-SY3R2]|uniref:TlpA family protein disulfide reductase n=1 Tax=Mesorhizobium sp. ANAO-SY3R2 TaxID=3166644 RepID=UPI00367358A5
MNAVSIGPLVLAADRASAIAGIMAFLVVSGLIARKLDESLAKWSSFALFAGLAAARAGHVAIHWDTFSLEPSRILALWQGGFYWPAGVAAAVMLLLPLVRDSIAKAAGLASLAAGLFVWHSAMLLTSGVEAIPLPGQPLHTLAGDGVSLMGLGEQPMVINLWASWCPPCRREMPMMATTAKATEGITFVFANQGEDAPRVRSYLAMEGIDPPNLLLDRLGTLGWHYKAIGMPATLFIGRDGRLVDAHIGEISREVFERKIADLHRD